MFFTIYARMRAPLSSIAWPRLYYRRLKQKRFWSIFVIILFSWEYYLSRSPDAIRLSFRLACHADTRVRAIFAHCFTTPLEHIIYCTCLRAMRDVIVGETFYAIFVLPRAYRDAGPLPACFPLITIHTFNAAIWDIHIVFAAPHFQFILSDKQYHAWLDIFSALFSATRQAPRCLFSLRRKALDYRIYDYYSIFIFAWGYAQTNAAALLDTRLRFDNIFHAPSPLIRPR